MDGADESGWSAVATQWAELWGSSTAPLRAALLLATATGPGSRLLDIGCGSGELLADAVRAGAVASGVDAAPRMVCVARATAPGADVRLGQAERLPWPDATFDVVTAVNVLQLAEDTLDAVREAARVLVPGGLLAVAGWAEGDLNDLDVVEAAVAAAAEEERHPDGELRREGGLGALLTDAGLEVVMADVVAVPWEPPDDDALVRGVLLGEDPETQDELRDVVLAAAAPFRSGAGGPGSGARGYRLVNHMRLAVGRATPRVRA